MKIYLGSAVYKQVHAGFHESVVLLHEQCREAGHELTEALVVGDALVDRARNIAASCFLRSDCDVLLTIDSDIWFRPLDAIRLCQQAMALDMVGALYVTRGLQRQPAMLLPEEEAIEFKGDSGPVAVPFLSTGFMAVHRRVFEHLSKMLPLCHQGWEDRGADTSFWPFYMPFTQPWPGDVNMYLSEDWAFCQRAKNEGWKCYLDPSIRLGHYGEAMFTLEDLARESKPVPGPMKLLRHTDGTLETFTKVGVARGKEQLE